MQSPLPSYSIIIETENLSLADSHCLVERLDSVRESKMLGYRRASGRAGGAGALTGCARP